jgi:hypothetical protein
VNERGAVDTNGHERLHDRLRAAVGDRTFRRVGELTNTHPETVRRYLSGHAPSVDFVSRLAATLGLNINWILTGRGPMRLAEVKPQVLRDANATDLLTHVALAIERLEARVDRLERYTQVLEVMIRQAKEPAPAPHAAIEPRPSKDEHGKPATTAAQGASARAEALADALAERPRPDAR